MFPPLLTTCPVRQPSIVPSTTQHVQRKKPASREASKPYQHKKAAQQAQTTETESSTDAGHNALMLKGGSSLSWLPPIISSSRSHYFSTLLNALCASEKPFDDFLKSSPVFLKNSRTTFESVWPHLRIRIETDDVLFDIVSLLLLMEFMTLTVRRIGLSTHDRKVWKGS
jgi:hypothetical protein